jgi:signal transduction histidine kinase
LVCGPEVPVILAAHTSCLPHGGRLTDLVGLLRARGRRIVRLGRARGRPSAEDALVRALCHDMRSSLSCLESALRCLGADKAAGDDVLAMAQAQAAHLASMLRTAEATGGAPPHDPGAGRPLPDVLAASVAASGLPRRQLTATLSRSAADVMVGDTRLQRILVNLLENAHRHGAGAPVRLDVTAHEGWVELAVNQSGGSAARVAGHLRTAVPPADVTGLGLWSVQRQARELGGRVVCEDGDGALIIRVQLPDR